MSRLLPDHYVSLLNDFLKTRRRVVPIMDVDSNWQIRFVESVSQIHEMAPSEFALTHYRDVKIGVFARVSSDPRTLCSNFAFRKVLSEYGLDHLQVFGAEVKHCGT